MGKGNGEGEGSGGWQSGLCDCCSSCENCLCGSFCTPCQVCSNARRLGDGCFLHCLLMFICGPSLPLCLQRGSVRQRNGYSGDACGDCIIACCCPCCTSIQIANELDHTGVAQVPLTQVVTNQPTNWSKRIKYQLNTRSEVLYQNISVLPISHKEKNNLMILHTTTAHLQCHERKKSYYDLILKQKHAYILQFQAFFSTTNFPKKKLCHVFFALQIWKTKKLPYVLLQLFRDAFESLFLSLS